MHMRILAGIAGALLTVGSGLAAAATPADSDPLKLGLILDMSGVYADVTGIGSETAARMAVEDFGGSVLGRKIEVMVADHQEKADLAAAIASRWFDVDHVTALMDVAASSPALAVMNVAQARDRIVMLDGPGATSITNQSCNATTVHYAFNTYALAHTVGAAVVQQGGKSWFFLTADYTFGHQLEGDTAEVITASGGQVLGDARMPLGTADFSSYLLAAQQSRAQVVGFALAGNDLINAVKQAAEFGLGAAGQRLSGLLVYINDIHSLGLRATQGMLLASSFYWDRDDASRAFAQRFFARRHKMPNMSQAGVYSGTLHYLHAVQDSGTTDAATVMRRMRATPIDDFFAHGGHIRADGLMVHDMYLFAAKSPAESKSEWDLYRPLGTIAGDRAFLPLEKSKCPLVKAAASQ